jgi:hypothetical protein
METISGGLVGDETQGKRTDLQFVLLVQRAVGAQSLGHQVDECSNFG